MGCGMSTSVDVLSPNKDVPPAWITPIVGSRSSDGGLHAKSVGVVRKPAWSESEQEDQLSRSEDGEEEKPKKKKGKKNKKNGKKARKQAKAKIAEATPSSEGIIEESVWQRIWACFCLGIGIRPRRTKVSPISIIPSTESDNGQASHPASRQASVLSTLPAAPTPTPALVKTLTDIINSDPPKTQETPARPSAPVPPSRTPSPLCWNTTPRGRADSRISATGVNNPSVLPKASAARSTLVERPAAPAAVPLQGSALRPETLALRPMTTGSVGSQAVRPKIPGLYQPMPLLENFTDSEEENVAPPTRPPRPDNKAKRSSKSKTQSVRFSDYVSVRSQTPYPDLSSLPNYIDADDESEDVKASPPSLPSKDRRPRPSTPAVGAKGQGVRSQTPYRGNPSLPNCIESESDEEVEILHLYPQANRPQNPAVGRRPAASRPQPPSVPQLQSIESESEKEGEEDGGDTISSLPVFPRNINSQRNVQGHVEAWNEVRVSDRDARSAISAAQHPSVDFDGHYRKGYKDLRDPKIIALQKLRPTSSYARRTTPAENANTIGGGVPGKNWLKEQYMNLKSSLKPLVEESGDQDKSDDDIVSYEEVINL